MQKPMGRPRKRRKVADSLEENPVLGPDRSGAPVSIENAPTRPDQPVDSACQMFDDISHPELAFNLINSYTSQSPQPFQPQDPLYENLGSIGSSVNQVDTDVTPPSNSPATPSLSSIAETFPSTLDWDGYLDLPYPLVPIAESDGPKTPPSDFIPSVTPNASSTNQYYPSNYSIPTPTNPFPVAPSCTCLVDLYLSLSSLSSLPSLPTNSHTVQTLQAATRTAHAVLYCPTCPHKFQSGMQNTMLLGTLLAVIADGWLRILRTPSRDLARSFDPLALSSATNPSTAPWTSAQDRKWKRFAHYLVRQYIFGDSPPPGIHLPGVCPLLSTTSSSQPHAHARAPIIILNNLCDAMERRQKTWHGDIEDGGEFPGPGHVSDETGAHAHGSEDEMLKRWRGHNRDGMKEPLCLKLVESVRTMLALVDRNPDRTPDQAGKQGEQCSRLCEVLGR